MVESKGELSVKIRDRIALAMSAFVHVVLLIMCTQCKP